MTESMTSYHAELLSNLDGFRVQVDADRERADVVLDRPPFNVVTMREREQLRLAFEALDHDERVRVIVLRGAGEHFSSGGYIKGFLEATPEHVSDLAWNVAAPARCRKPVIAALRGYCFGVGFELALACDFRVCSRSARFALPEQRLGQIPGSGGSVRLLHMIGMQRTKDMTFRSRRVTGEEAHDWGIVLECVDEERLEATVDALAEELRGFSPLAQRTIKGVLNAAAGTTLEAGIEIEGQAYARLRCSEDFAEGVEAFHAKRRPRFRGR